MARGRMTGNTTIGETGWAAVAEGLAQNSTLEKLDLKECDIDDASAVAIGGALKTNTGLKTLV